MKNKDDNKMVQFGKSGKVFFNGKPIGFGTNIHFLLDPADVGKDITIKKCQTPGPSEYNFAELLERESSGYCTAEARWEHKTPEQINEDLLSAMKRMNEVTKKALFIAGSNPFKKLAKQAAKDFKDFSILKVIAPSYVKELKIKTQGLELTFQCRDDLDILRDRVLFIKGKILKEEKTLLAKLATEEPMDVNIKGRRHKWLNKKRK